MSLKNERKKAAEKAFKMLPVKFVEIDLVAERKHPFKSAFVPWWMTRAFRNNQYTVMINDKAKTSVGPAIRVMIQRHDDGVFKSHWATIQRIKNEIFGKETVAIEYYPKESELVNDHNIFWIWVFQEGQIPKIIND